VPDRLGDLQLQVIDSAAPSSGSKRRWLADALSRWAAGRRKASLVLLDVRVERDAQQALLLVPVDVEVGAFASAAAMSAILGGASNEFAVAFATGP
jgi:hypothetical protein